MYKNILLFFLVISVVWSCADADEAESVADQKEYILSYLESNGYSYSNVGGVYRVTFPSSSSTSVTLEKGDTLQFYHAQYTFDSDFTSLYNTNILDLAIEYDMDITGMDFNPYTIKYGTTDIIEGYEQGFSNVNQGDTLLLFITSDLAYGNKELSTLDKNQSIASYVIIEKIVK